MAESQVAGALLAQVGSQVAAGSPDCKVQQDPKVPQVNREPLDRKGPLAIKVLKASPGSKQ